MKLELKKEIPLLIIAVLPFIYLAYLWSDLPDQVPMHWNIQGEVDRWGSKNSLFIIPLLLTGLTYTLLAILQKIDPKNQIEKMGGKYQSLRFALLLIMSALSIFIIYTAQSRETTMPSLLFIIIGILISTLGNFFKTIKPNYFLGIRTPWTLENQEVWKLTHLMAGKIWFIAGLIIIMIALISSSPLATYSMIGIFIIIAIIPILYSYIISKKINTAK